MKVKAAPGLQVPHEFDPRTYIGETDAEEVPETPYYIRRLASGELLDVDALPPPKAVAVKKADKGGAQ